MFSEKNWKHGDVLPHCRDHLILSDHHGYPQMWMQRPIGVALQVDPPTFSLQM